MDVSSFSWISWFKASIVVKAETGGAELDDAKAVGGGAVGLGVARWGISRKEATGRCRVAWRTTATSSSSVDVIKGIGLLKLQLHWILLRCWARLHHRFPSSYFVPPLATFFPYLPRSAAIHPGAPSPTALPLATSSTIPLLAAPASSDSSVPLSLAPPLVSTSTTADALNREIQEKLFTTIDVWFDNGISNLVY